MRNVLRMVDESIKKAIHEWARERGLRYWPDDGLLVRWSDNERFGDIVLEPLEINYASAATN